ncbi:MAG: hypothetical protein JO294_12515 [Alphaproteobacteria bacterium]|nr:hypothetical protein [Alphaproteobacteria bacterium]
MQLSAANLLIASQQLARGGATKPDANAQAQFTAALKEKGVETAEFAPMEFKQAAPAKAAATATPATPATGYNPGQRLGANLDIRV